jgi:hypothetical protein
MVKLCVKTQLIFPVQAAVLGSATNFRWQQKLSIVGLSRIRKYKLSKTSLAAKAVTCRDF